MHTFILPPTHFASRSSKLSFTHHSHPRFQIRSPFPSCIPQACLNQPSNSAPQLRVSSPLWRLLAETALQVSVAAFAVAASVLARTKFLAFASAFFCVPQVILAINRYLKERATVSELKKRQDKEIGNGELVHDVQVAEKTPRGGELSSVTALDVRAVVSEEVDSLRHVVEQVERAAMEREESRNRSVAQAIGSLDRGIRMLRRTVETRNQVENSAPFALVSELELLQGRLKDAELQKEQLEARLKVTEANFEEAKRAGERVRQEVEERIRREMGLREELVAVSARLARMEGMVDRVELVERINSELRERILGTIREKEELKGRAGDAEKRVLRFEGLVKGFKEKFSGFGEEDDVVKEEKFAERRSRRGMEAFGEGSLLYEELGGERVEERVEKRVEEGVGKEWPERVLEAKPKNNKKEMQLEGLPPDGGFGKVSGGIGNGDEQKQISGGEEELKQLQGTANDTIFSFSRGEFDGITSSLESWTQETVGEETPTARANQEKFEKSRSDISSTSTSADIDDTSPCNEQKAEQPGMTPSDSKNGSRIATDAASVFPTESNFALNEVQAKSSEIESVAGSSATSVSSSSQLKGRGNIDEHVAEGNTGLQKESETGIEESANWKAPPNEAVAEEAISQAPNTHMSGLKAESEIGECKAGDSSVLKEPEEHEIVSSEETSTSTENVVANVSTDWDKSDTGVTQTLTDEGTTNVPYQSDGQVGQVSAHSTDLERSDAAAMHKSTSEKTANGVDKNVGHHARSEEPLAGTSMTTASFSATKAEDSRDCDELVGAAESIADTKSSGIEGSTVDRASLLEKQFESANVEGSDAARVLSGAGNADLLGDKSEASHESKKGLMQDSGTGLSGLEEGTVVKNDAVEGVSSNEGISENSEATTAFGDKTDRATEQEDKRSTEGKKQVTAEDVMLVAKELVKKARRRGLAISQSELLFKRAVSRLEAARGAGADRAVVEGQLGATLLSWAKMNMADAEAHNRLTRAQECLSWSLEQRPDDEVTMSSCGLCLCLLASMSDATTAKGFYQRACGLFDRLVEINSQSRIGCYNCGLAYVSLARLGVREEKMDVGLCMEYFETAAGRFRKSLELKGEDGKAQAYLDDCVREIAKLQQ